MKYKIQKAYTIEDKKIIFNDNSIFKFLPYAGYGRGSQSDVYRIRVDDNFYALKIFNGLREEKIENYENKLNINIDSFISPIKLSYINDKFNGYLMKYCSGTDLEKEKLNISIDEFGKSVKKIEKDTHLLSELRYILYDTFIANVMYDCGFKLIDIDDYIYEKDKDITKIDEINKKRLNLLLTDIFLKNTGLARLFYQNVELTKLKSECISGRITFDEFYSIICNMAMNYSEDKLNLIGDIGKVLIKSKKM